MVEPVILVSLSISRTMSCCDVGAAFSHASVTTNLDAFLLQKYVTRDQSCGSLGTSCTDSGRLPSPGRFTLTQLLSGRGYVRFQSEANVYVTAALTIVVLAYVDDLMVV